MKAVVLLVTIKFLVDITLSSCSRVSEGTVKWIWTENEGKYEIELCLFNLTCYQSVMPITDCKTTHCNSDNISYILEALNNCTCSQFAASTQDFSPSTMSMINSNPSTISTQDILIPLLAILAALLVVVTVGWVCTCCAMHKSRRREMNINSTNIR